MYGFGIFFRVDESCVGRHFYERRPWARNDESADSAENQAVAQAEPAELKSDEYNGSVEDLDIAESIEYSKEASDQMLSSNQNILAPIEGDMSNSSDSGSDDEFPDTMIEIESTDKYNLSVLNESLIMEAEDASHPGSIESNSNSSRHLSAKQRRDLKKKGTITENSKDSSFASSEISSKVDEPLSSKKPLPRGKKGKLKKMKEKYAEQDEEDRELITKFLGSAQGPQPKGKKAKAQAARKVHLEELQKEREKRKTELDRQKPPPAVVKNENLEIQKILEEENILFADDDQTGDLTYLDSLTGQPHQDDILLFAIPVCAPWNALQKFKYKVKLTPGSLKKGKAAKSALSSFIAVGSGPDGRVKELELIKSIQENELIMQMLGKVKISGPTIERKGKK